MSRYKDSNKYKIYGEDAILAARFDKYLDATLRNCRADYLKALSKRKQWEIPYEDLPDAEKETVQESSAADDEIEFLLFWEALKTHLHAHRHLRRWQAYKCRGTYSRTRTEDSGGQAASSSVRTFHSSRWVWRRQQPRIP